VSLDNVLTAPPVRVAAWPICLCAGGDAEIGNFTEMTSLVLK
jgi:hypothetical protein